MTALGLGLSGLVGMAVYLLCFLPGPPAGAATMPISREAVLGVVAGLLGGCVALALRRPLVKALQMRHGAPRWLLAGGASLLTMLAAGVIMQMLALLPGAPMEWVLRHWAPTGTDATFLGLLMGPVAAAGALVSALIWLYVGHTSRRSP